MSKVRIDMAKDTGRAWTGVRRVRDVTIGETHSEQKQRKLREVYAMMAKRGTLGAGLARS